MNKIEYVIHSNLSKEGKLVIGAQSVELNANCAVVIHVPEEILEKIMSALNQCKKDLLDAHKNGKLIMANSKCNPCIVLVGTNTCKKCGEVYR